MRRFEVTPDKDDILDKVFSYLRGKKQGVEIKVRSEGGNIKVMKFIRRGQENVSVIDPETGIPDLVPLERVVVE